MKYSMAEMKLYELEMPRSRIDHGEQERISFLTPEQFFLLCCLTTMILVLVLERPPHRRKFSVCWQRTGCLLGRLRFYCR